MFSLKLIQITDADAYASVVSAIHPDEKVDPDVLRARWRDEARHPEAQARYIVFDHDAICGLAFWSCPQISESDGPRMANVNVRLTPPNQSEEEFAWILKAMEEGAEGAQANVARAVTREDEPFHRAMLERHGYSVDRVSQSWSLDLVRHQARLLGDLEQSRMVMQDCRITITTLAGAARPDAWRRLYELTAATVPDIPATLPEPIPSFETWLLRMQGPDVHQDRIWTAWAVEHLVGYSYLTYPREGDVWTGFTATRREERRRGIARAVKLETIGQAIELGEVSIRTNNDLENHSILHINEALGYERLPGLVTHLKALS